MNQEKIGKFILEQRKKKKMTQQELSEKLGVTDRTISNWENGKNMPDLSLFKPLCEELDITANELLSGEKIKKENYQEKSEENIFNTIDYSKNKIKKTRNKFLIILTIIISFIILIITLFFIDINRMRNNEPVIFSTWGFNYMPPINLSDEEIYLTIEEYIVEKSDSESKRYDNEKTFVSMKIYLIDELEKDKIYHIYAWVLEEKYYYENGKVEQDSGSSIPHKFVVEKQNDQYIVTDSRIPRDGSYYPKDMKKIFPSSVRNDMDKAHKDGTIERLQLDIQKQVNLYFHQ